MAMTGHPNINPMRMSVTPSDRIVLALAIASAIM
jgi:hypothetical protein